MHFQFTITDNTQSPPVSTVVEEPKGWDSITLKIDRSEKYHGFFDYWDDGQSDLEFDGIARDILSAAYNTFGIDADVIITVEYVCDSTSTMQLLYEGRFDFNRYEFICSDRCYVRCGVEKASCLQQFFNRTNERVNLDSNASFDAPCVNESRQLACQFVAPNRVFIFTTGAIIEELQKIPIGSQITITGTTSNNGTFTLSGTSTAGLIAQIVLFLDTVVTNENALATLTYCYTQDNLTAYPKLGYSLPLHSKKLKLKSEWLMPASKTTVISGLYATSSETGLKQRRIFNAYDVVLDDLIKTSSGTDTLTEAFAVDGNLYEVDLTGLLCDGSDFSVSIDVDGNYNHSTTASVSYDIIIALSKRATNGVITTVNQQVITSGTSGTVNVNFSYNYSGTLSLEVGERLYVFVFGQWLKTTTGTIVPELTIDAGSKISITVNSECPSSVAKSYLVHESLSRIAEAYTNDCLRVYSEYFGREDSQPFSFDSDGCGGLEALTNGFLIRNVLQTNGGTHSLIISFDELYDGLNAIHNIGMDVEQIGYNEVLRIEPQKHYYQDTEVFQFNNVREVKYSPIVDKHYNIFKAGFAKWEAEEINGIDEFLTERQYKTTLANNKNELEQVCQLIAAGYTIEITRRKYSNNTKDWKYDKDTFIVCLRRLESDNFESEQGSILLDDGQNIYDYQSLYNVRISPLSMALRWLPELLAALPNEVPLKFVDGTGNVLAEFTYSAGELCVTPKLNMPIREDSDLTNQIIEAVQSTFKRYNRIEFEYPLTYNDYLTLISGRHGYCTVNCGNGLSLSGWIKTIDFQPVGRVANVTLIERIPPPE